MSIKQPGEEGVSKLEAMAPEKRRFYITFTIIGAIILLAGAFWLVQQVWTPIAIILFSAFLVFLLRAPVDFFERKGLPRVIGTFIMYVIALSILAAIILLFVPVAAEQVIGFFSTVPQYLQQAQTFISQTFTQIDEYLKQTGIQDAITTISIELAKFATTFASSSATAMVNAATSLGTSLVVAGVSAVVCFWILKDLPRFRAEARNLLGPRYLPEALVIANAFSRAIGGYLRGMVVACICTGTLAFIAYSIIGVPYPLVVALFTGLMVFIPILGPISAWVFSGLIGLLVSPLTAVLAVLLTITCQLLYDYLVAPRIMGSHVALHPAVVLVAILVGATLGGIFGMLCAIPIASAIKTIFIHYFEKKTGRQLTSEHGALFMESRPLGGNLQSEASGARSGGLYQWFPFIKKRKQPSDDSTGEDQQ
ncbi:MAG: AI-2E family transporter [Coriobacteriia bacterium]|nr:AI-2E family transporter [Coriobacteriia bacterium]